MLLFPLQPDILLAGSLRKEAVARRPAPGFGVARESGIRSRNFQTLTGLQVIHVLLEFQNRSRTLESASIQFQHLAGRHSVFSFGAEQPPPQVGA